MDWTVITVRISSRPSDGRAACLADHAGGPREAKEAFVTFIDKMLATVERKKRGSAIDLQVVSINELDFINALLEYKTQILQLKQSTANNCNL